MKNNLRFTIICLTAVLFTFSSFSQNPCLKAWYQLNGNGTDISGNANHGVVYGATATTGHYGHAGGALHFNGISDRVVLTDDFDFQERTISLWLKADTFQVGGQWIYDSDHSSMLYGHTQIYVEKQANINKICLAIGGNFFKYDDLKANSWYHAAVSVHLGYIKFYINGVMQDSIANNSLNHSNTGAYVARFGTTRLNDRYYEGSIDDARIYNCGLSDAEIYQVYSDNHNCLTAFYKLDGNAADSSGNDYNGTLSGTTNAIGYTGVNNTALLFNGISDKVNLPVAFDFSERTVSLIFKADAYSTLGEWVYDSDHATLLYGHTQIYTVDESGINKICLGVGTNFYKYSNALPNTWYHAAISVQPAYVKFYINGILKDSVPNNNFNHSTDGDNFAKIGTTRNNNRYFHGTVDEVKIFHCGLGESEISQLYTSLITSIDDVDSDKPVAFQLYPNPANYIVIIETPQKATIEIINIEGQIMKSVVANESNTKIDVSDLSAGMYFAKVKTENGMGVKKFIKE